MSENNIIKKGNARKAIIIAGVILLAVIYLLFDPGSGLLFPKCPFFMLTGMKCPGCGSQRAIHALLNFDIATAFHQNALLVSSLPYVIALIFTELFYRKKLWIASLRNILNSRFMIIPFAVATVAFWILRNIC